MAIETINPATGERVGGYDEFTVDEIEGRLKQAAGAFGGWSHAPLTQRVAVLRRAADLLDERRDDFARLMTLEMGKLIAAGREEAAKCALGCRFYADRAAEMLADEVVPRDGERSYVAHHPLGVVLAVMPWNFPFWQVFRFAAPALAVGNTALLKHASNVPQCALAIEQIFRDAGAPDGVFQTLLVTSQRIPEIIADRRIAAVTLTGSEGAGADVASHAGKHIKRTVLELGGSDPFIIMPSANLDRAIDTAVKARTINNGQSCIAAKRFIVHERIADTFEQRFVRAMQSLKVGDPIDPATELGPLATRQGVADLEKQVDETVRLGARLLTGGKRIDGRGFYFEPTVLTNVQPSSPAYRDELFGPVASLFRARSTDDAIRIANDTRFGLGAAAWTSDPHETAHFARELQAGMVFVNGMVASDPQFPFGGVKASGFGRELSAHGLREFVNIKTVRIFDDRAETKQSASRAE
jgi:succinate-semialdehyde dehydrogenase/glutarate-semialdehyde dehydrogenase